MSGHGWIRKEGSSTNHRCPPRAPAGALLPGASPPPCMLVRAWLPRPPAACRAGMGAPARGAPASGKTEPRLLVYYYRRAHPIRARRPGGALVRRARRHGRAGMSAMSQIDHVPPSGEPGTPMANIRAVTRPYTPPHRTGSATSHHPCCFRVRACPLFNGSSSSIKSGCPCWRPPDRGCAGGW
jgi:hypothetical protein